MNMKKLSRYRDQFYNYLQKASASWNPEQKISIYNKILRIIKKLQLVETKGKVRVKPSLVKLEKYFSKGKKDISRDLKGSN